MSCGTPWSGTESTRKMIQYNTIIDSKWNFGAHLKEMKKVQLKMLYCHFALQAADQSESKTYGWLINMCIMLCDLCNTSYQNQNVPTNMQKHLHCIKITFSRKHLYNKNYEFLSDNHLHITCYPMLFVSNIRWTWSSYLWSSPLQHIKFYITLGPDNQFSQKG